MIGKHRPRFGISIASRLVFLFFLATSVQAQGQTPPPTPAPTPGSTAPAPARPNGNGGNVGEEKGPTPVMLTSPGIQADIHSSVHLDFMGFDNGEQYIANAGTQENTYYLRRARLTIRGKLWGLYGFNFQAAFEIPADPIIDAAIIIPVAPGVDFSAGKMKLPFSEERLKSFATHQPLMERSLASNLELRRSQGAMFSVHPGSGLVSFYFGQFTGENMYTANTDDDFEYVGRVVFRADSTTLPNTPGSLQLGFSAAQGRRAPVRITPLTSFTGKTQNELVFFSAVPVNGSRTRYEADLDWRYKSLWLGGEWIKSDEERNSVRVTLDTNGDGASDQTTGHRDLSPLHEMGWMAYGVWYLTGEPASPNITPLHKGGALGLAVRYSYVSFDNQEDRILNTAGTGYGREVSVASTALGRPSVNETVRDLYVGFDWVLRQGVFIQFAADWQWFDYSSTFYSDPDKHADINYRARVGMTF